MNKKFETYADALADPMCYDLINKTIEKIGNDRTDAVVKARMNSMLVNKQSIRLKSSAFSKLQDMGILNDKGLLREFIEIQNKRSTLPSRERSFIQAIVVDAMEKVIYHYESHVVNDNIDNISQQTYKESIYTEGEGMG